MMMINKIVLVSHIIQLMDGRKSVGGKLEVKLRLRNPLKNKQIEEMKEKILIIDQFLRKVSIFIFSYLYTGPSFHTTSSFPVLCPYYIKCKCNISSEPWKDF